MKLTGKRCLVTGGAGFIGSHPEMFCSFMLILVNSQIFAFGNLK